jgi:hypothetical protein
LALFRTVQVPVLWLFFTIINNPKVAGANIWRIGSVRSSGNSQAMQFIHCRCPLWDIELSSWTRKSIEVLRRGKHFFSRSNDGTIWRTKWSCIYFCHFGSASRAISWVDVKQSSS